MMRYLLLVTLTTAMAGPMAPARAQAGPPPPTVRAVRISAEPSGGAVTLDGILDDAAWAGAPVATGFTQREPDEGADPTERTEVRVIYDRETLYVGVMAYDRSPGEVIARTLQRDQLMEIDNNEPVLLGDDAVAILFDPFHDHRNAVVFATNPNGAEFEALITDEGREFNTDWRGVWRVAAAVHAEGWSAEFAIPFRTLRYPTGSTVGPWGFNVYRSIRRKNEDVLWSAWSRDEGFQRVSRAGHLEGLTDLPRPSINLEMKPFVLSRGTQVGIDGSAGDLEGQLDAGLDVKWEVRPGLLLDLTANTDFAQVEVDDQQVNLTRFSLFFPEKRDFFLENSGIFEFGTRGIGFGGTPPFLLFFSRRIGLNQDGEVPVIGGARLTGRIGGQTVALLNVVTDAVPGTPTTNFAVARVKRDIGGRNFIGGILTDRRDADANNTAAGVDFSYWPTGQLNVQGFATRMQTSGAGGDDNSYNLKVDYRSDFWTFQGSHLFIGTDAEARMGFITRTDLRSTSARAQINPRPDWLGLRRIGIFSTGSYLTNAAGALRDWEIRSGFSPNWDTGDNFVLSYTRSFSRLDEGFALTDDVFVPADDYDMWEVGGFVQTSTNRPVALNVNYSYQRFFDGTLWQLGGDAQVRAGSHLSFTLGFSHDNVDIPFGAFDANIGSLRLTYAASTKVITNALFQYNSLDRVISTNIRFNFIHRPGSDLFVVFTEERGTPASVWDFENRGMVAKLTYLTRF